MRSLRRFREAGFAVECVPEAEGPVRTRLLPDPSAALADGELVKRNMYRSVARVQLGGLGPVALKVHVPHGLADRIRNVFRASRARAEWRAARYLEGAGIPTARPLLVAERRRGPLLEKAAYATSLLEDRTTFEPALLAHAPRERHALERRAAAWIRAFHDRGVSHGDLHSGNVLVGGGPGDLCDLRILDLHTARVGRPVPRWRRDAQLARWLHSLSASTGPGGRLRSLLAYLGSRPADRSTRAAWARLSRRLAAWERRRVRSRSRRCTEENIHFTSDCTPWIGWRRHEWTPDRIDRALRAHDRALAEGGPAVLKAGRKSRVTRHGDVVVKESLTASRVLRTRAGYRNAHGLEVRGFLTAHPFACVRRNGRAIALYQDLSRLPRLDRRVREVRASRAWAPARHAAFLDATADFVARLHRQGVWHGDLKAVNLLLAEENGRFGVHVVDTDRMRFRSRPLPWRRRMRNLAQLAASVPAVVTRTDRLRWWRRYAKASGLAGAALERRAARDVARALARKTVVVDAPIE
jgi:tRNA A-37 threonylcarbamoyl transferase component Bud32